MYDCACVCKCASVWKHACECIRIRMYVSGLHARYLFYSLSVCKEMCVRSCTRVCLYASECACVCKQVWVIGVSLYRCAVDSLVLWVCACGCVSAGATARTSWVCARVCGGVCIAPDYVLVHQVQ
jgi:hypothetical protein